MKFCTYYHHHHHRHHFHVTTVCVCVYARVYKMCARCNLIDFNTFIGLLTIFTRYAMQHNGIRASICARDSTFSVMVMGWHELRLEYIINQTPELSRIFQIFRRHLSIGIPIFLYFFLWTTVDQNSKANLQWKEYKHLNAVIFDTFGKVPNMKAERNVSVFKVFGSIFVHAMTSMWDHLRVTLSFHWIVVIISFYLPLNLQHNHLNTPVYKW